ncbi:MAG: antitoxin [Oligoflexia bacterium]|nr:antitoxin [Oligoflexia bacterium]
MAKKLYTKQELKLLKSIEDEPEKWKPVSEKEKQKYVKSASEYVKNKKQKRITIRINEKDLQKLQTLAQKEGLPYQTYITSMLHKMAEKRLVDKELLNEMMNSLKKAA